MKTLALFGAGKIGRSFIGQLFSRAGYEVAFIDINKRVIDALNERQGYEVIIKGEQDESIQVSNVRGVMVNDVPAVIEELVNADVAAVSVGKNALPYLIPNIAKALEQRHAEGKGPLDIIIAENMRDAADFMREALVPHLPADFPLDDMVGLVETSIGKMVPIMPKEVEDRDPLLVFAECYNTLIVDGRAFKNPLPEIEGLAPKNNMKAWVDRKSFIHNLGHAVVAYMAYLQDPSLHYVWEALEIPEIQSFTREAMLESATVLMAKYPGEFKAEDLEQHVDDLLARFQNKALGDTIFRVGCDLPRKLSADDRVAGVVLEGASRNLPVEKALMTLASGYLFRAGDDQGYLFPADEEFAKRLEREGFEPLLRSTSGISDDLLVERLKSAYDRLSGRSPLEPGNLSIERGHELSI